MVSRQTNWAGNYHYQAPQWHFPETIEQLQEIVRSAEKVKAVGSRHSFNHISDSQEVVVSLGKLAPEMTIDRAGMSVTVSGNVRYGELGRFLHTNGFALHNLASLPHISVVGACATATHGSGVGHGNLATAVSAMEFVAADGSLQKLSRDESGERFAGAAVSLGGLGVITKMTLDILPAFEVRQIVYEKLPQHELAGHFETIMSGGYSVSLFTDWRDGLVSQVWLKEKVEANSPSELGPSLYGAKLATVKRHPIMALSAESCTPQLGRPGPWYERLPHFKLDFTPSAGEELQAEYFVPRAQAYRAIEALSGMGQQLAPLLLISEIRTIAADKLWLSPCYGQDCVAFHFTWKPDWEQVKQLLPKIEGVLEPFGVRPHWGKLFTMPPAAVQARYERLPDFRELLEQYDPEGKFRNAFLDAYIFAGQ